MIPVPELEKMLLEVIDDVARGEPDRYEADPERRARRQQFRQEVLAIRRRGQIVDIPTELP
jgi:hypothetical protein